MGDILHALPAVTALRQVHPNWVIDWVVEPRWRALLAADDASGRGVDQPIVDRIHLAATKDWRRAALSGRTLREIGELRSALRLGGYDAVIDLQGAVRSAVVARLAGCKRVIGEDEPREKIARLLFTERVATKGAHVIEQDLELATAIAGDELTPVQPLLPLDAKAEVWADALFEDSTPAVLMNPGAGWGAKRWPVERYGEVAKGMRERGYRVLVNGGPGEEGLLETIEKAAGGGTTPLQCSLPKLIAVTRRIRLAIGGDTGPLHLACALGRPVVGIYGPTDPSRNGPYGTMYRVLRSPMSRKDHTRRADPEAGLLTIQPEEVLRAADELLAEGAKL